MTEQPIEVDVEQSQPPTLDVVAESTVEVQPAPDTQLDVTAQDTQLDASTDETVVEVDQGGVELEVAAVGPAGAPGHDGQNGRDGRDGAQGPPGSVDNASYIWQQNDPSATWVITHNLTFRPAVTVVDSGGTTVEGAVHYLDANTIVLEFDAAFGGAAYLS